jgi:hypothetical protein
LTEGWKEKREQNKPWIKTIERENYILRIAVIHARSGEHVTGADLVFEVKDKKLCSSNPKELG